MQRIFPRRRLEGGSGRFGVLTGDQKRDDAQPDECDAEAHDKDHVECAGRELPQAERQERSRQRAHGIERTVHTKRHAERLSGRIERDHRIARGAAQSFTGPIQ
jgi:hypothetical protein